MAFVCNLAPMANALRWYAEATDKELPVIVNKKMKDVVIRTYLNSPSVSQGQISAELQEYYAAKAYVATGKRAGQLRKKATPLYRPWPLARAIIAKRLLTKGVNPRSLGGSDFNGKIDAMIKSRLSSGSYLKSGWIPAMRLFGASTGGVAQWSNHGDGILATVGNAVAQISNDVVLPWDGDSAGYRRAFEAVQDALDEVAEDTLAHADELLMRGWADIEKQLR